MAPRPWCARLRPRALAAFVALVAFGLALATTDRAKAALPATIDSVQPRVAKIYGAGGFRGLEAYQSGAVISAEGHILTVWSYVLDSDEIVVVLDDGRRFTAQLLGADPRLEVAILKIDAEDLPHFDLNLAAGAATGTRVLAFSNLYGVATGDEAASVQHGVISARTRLEARRGTFETPYRGDVYVLDAITNNPGAAGGVLTDWQGRLLGLLGKELRNSLNNTWLNYAMPIGELADAVDRILAGELSTRPAADSTVKPTDPLSLDALGIVLVPDVLPRTPPYVDLVRTGSAADDAGLLPDDLVLFVNDHLVQSCRDVRGELEYIDRGAVARLTVLRDNQLVEIVLAARRSALPVSPEDAEP